MTFEGAMTFARVREARDRISNSRIGFMDKIRGLAALSEEVDEAPPPKGDGRLSLGKMIHGAIGAGVGLGLAKGISREMNLSPKFSRNLQIASAGLGALMNMGMMKFSETEEEINNMKTAADQLDKERRHAFRFGFMKAIKESGYFEKDAAMLPIPVVSLDPTALASIPRSFARGVTGTGRMAGSLLGAADAPDAVDEEVTRLQVEEALLEEQLERLKADRKNAALKQLLAKRKKSR